MTTVRVPALCPSCGALFESRLLAISGNVKNLTLSGNKETCPFCGNWADIAEGIFDVAGDVLSVVSAPRVTHQMLAEFGAALRRAYEEKQTPDELARQVEKIDPSFGDIVRKAGNSPFYIVSLLLLLAAIKSCNLDIKLDANRLIDQLRGTPPAEVLSVQQEEP